MPWTHIAHPSCIKPLFGLAFTPHGSTWTCDHCGKRWMVDRSGERAQWRRVDLTGVEIADAIRQAEAARMASTEIVDVAWRERRAALAHLHRGFDSLYAEFGLQRTPSTTQPEGARP